jgi:hypothetical protein
MLLNAFAVSKVLEGYAALEEFFASLNNIGQIL